MRNNIRILLPFLLFTLFIFSSLSHSGEIEIHPDEKPYLDALIKRLNIDKRKIKIWSRSIDEEKKKRTDYYKEFGNYKYFYLHDNPHLQNINFITNYDGRVVYLRVLRKDLVDLREIQHFKYLKWLDIHLTNIKSLKGVENLVNLEKFEFSGNDKIGSLSDLKNLPKLRILLPNTSENITDISGMKNLPNLKEFDCGYCDISDISVLSDFPLLENLDIGTTDKTLKSIESLKKLEVLRVNSKTLTDISAISNLVNLKELEITDTKATELIFSKVMPKLKKISLHTIPLNELPSLAKTPNLEYLLVILSGINKFELPANLDKLNVLKLVANKNLKVMPRISSMPNLERLELTKSPISKIEIDNLPKLNKLDLSGTNITEVGDFSKFPSLRELYLRDTKVTSLEPILDAPRLWLVGLDRSARDIPNVSLITKALKVNALTRYGDDDTPTAREKYQQLIAEQKESVSEKKQTSRRRRN